MDLNRHNYYRKVLGLIATGKIKAGELADVDIYHDDWCGIYRGCYCNCKPEIRIRKRRTNRIPKPSQN